jgi:hypothetical protein
MEFSPLKDAVKMGKKDAFLQNVRRDVIRALIKRGRLQGKKVKGKECVLVDDTFHQVMRFGVESFVYNQQGFSFTAIHAPIGEVARAFKARKDVLAYTESVRPVELSDDVSVTPREDRRDSFLVKTRASEWPVLVQTVHWIQSSDMLMSVFLAAGLSAALKTQAVAAWDDDFSGSTLLLCDKGGKSKVISTEADEWADFYLFFYEQGIHLPECFIHSDGKQAEFAVREPAEIKRVDHVVLAIPEESQVSGPHVGYKLGQMAGALAEGLEDESAFVSHQVDGLWQRAQVLLKAGK